MSIDGISWKGVGFVILRYGDNVCLGGDCKLVDCILWTGFGMLRYGDLKTMFGGLRNVLSGWWMVLVIVYRLFHCPPL